MDPSALAVAVVGVLGTLLSPVVTQRLSLRARQEEFRLQKAHRDEDRGAEERRARLEQKRACYVAMTATSRRYRIEQMNHLFAVVHGRVDAEGQQALRAAREAYVSSVAETHMTAPAPVLAALEEVTSSLSRTYRLIKHLEDGRPDPDWPAERIEESLVRLWDHWIGLRQAMRADLGVPD